MRGAFPSVLLTVLALVGLGAMIYFIMHFATAQVCLPNYYWFVPVFGAGGGAVGGLIRNNNKLALCRIQSPDKILLGVIGDISVGLGGACAVVFLFGNTLKVDQKESSVLLISISFIAGAFGRAIVQLAGQKLDPRLKDEMKAAVEEEFGPAVVSALINDAIRYNDSEDKKDIPQALTLAEQALKYDPQNIIAYGEKARALKRLGRLDEALAAVDEALRISPGDARLIYNKACYMSLLKMDNEKILANLKKACQTFPVLCELARTDGDLNGLRALPRFRELMLSLIEEGLRASTSYTPETMARLRYSKACYMALLGRDKGEIVEELRAAFATDPKLKERAQNEPDLAQVRGLPEFESLSGATA